MITGISHIIDCIGPNGRQANPRFGNLEAKFEERLPSSSSKTKFCHQNQTYHTLRFWEKDGCLPVEEIQYDTVFTQKRPFLSLPTANELLMLSRKPEADALLLEEVIGFEKISDSEFLYDGITGPTLHCRIEITELNEPMLDHCGMNVISFFCADHQRVLDDFSDVLTNEPLHHTEPFSVTVNGNNLDVMIFRAPGGVFIELLAQSSSGH